MFSSSGFGIGDWFYKKGSGTPLGGADPFCAVAIALPPEAKHCSSLCSQSEGHEHVANMASALGRVFKIQENQGWQRGASAPERDSYLG